MATVKGEHCVGCPQQKSGHGFVQIKPVDDQSKIELVILSDIPTYEAVDDGDVWAGKSGWWLRRNWLGNIGLEQDQVIYDNTLRCRTNYGKGNFYPNHKQGRSKAEECCSHYSVHPGLLKKVPFLCVADAPAANETSVDTVGAAHGHIEVVNGRVVGCTYNPKSVMANPNLLPLVIRETTNLLEAARNPKVLERPKVVKGDAPYLPGREAVVDLEWHYTKATKAIKAVAAKAATKKKAAVDAKPAIEAKPAKHGDVNVVGIAYEAGKSYSTHDVNHGMETVGKHFADGTRIIGHNFINADLPRIVETCGAEPKSFGPDHLIDTMIVAHLIHPHWSELGLFSLEDLVRFYRPTSMWKSDKQDLLLYNGYDTAYNFALWEDLKIDLDLTDQWHLVEKDQRLAYMTNLMRQRGIRIDSVGLHRFDEDWKLRREAIKDGLPFNPNAHQQIKKYFEANKVKLSATGYDVLVSAIRRKDKYVYDNTFVDADGSLMLMEGFDSEKVKQKVLLQLIDYKDEGKGIKAWFSDVAIALGRIYPKFNVTGTAVARFSSSDPNAQNVPPDYRRYMLPEDGCFFGSFDGKNIEGRTVAWNAQDQVMLADFASGKDIHALVASRIFSKRFEDVTKDERQGGKRTVHASNYLETAKSLSGRLYGNAKEENVSKATKLQDGYFGAYSRTREWQLELKEQMSRGDIMLRNPFGRVRMIYAPDDHERAKRACHFLGCSTGAEVVNQKALDIQRELGLIPYSVVHDELLYSFEKGSKGERQVADVKELLHLPIPEMDGFVIPFGCAIGTGNYGKYKKQTNPEGLREDE